MPCDAADPFGGHRTHGGRVAPGVLPKTTRRAYHHGDLRRALLDAGVALARAGGPEAVVLRAATRAAGVAPNAAYRHFADRDALLGAVSLHAQAQVAAAMEHELAQVAGEADPLRPGPRRRARRRRRLPALRPDRAGAVPHGVLGQRRPAPRRRPGRPRSGRADAVRAARRRPRRAGRRRRPGAEQTGAAPTCSPGRPCTGWRRCCSPARCAASTPARSRPLGRRLLDMVERGLPGLTRAQASSASPARAAPQPEQAEQRRQLGAGGRRARRRRPPGARPAPAGPRRRRWRGRRPRGRRGRRRR